MRFYRSNVAEVVGIVWTILSIIGSFILGEVFKVDVGIYSEILKYNWGLVVISLMYTAIQAYILYCIYAHFEYQERIIESQNETNKQLNTLLGILSNNNNQQIH